MTAALTAVSLFSGCGGFDWGATHAGVRIIWANDRNPHAAAAYTRLFPDVPFILDDVRNITAFPQADILIGCYPCTGFSVASRRRWRQEETRDLRANADNYLFRYFLHALTQVRPKYLFVENVRGMTTAENGWFLEEQLRGFQEQGYRVEYKLLDAAWYGVAQSRKRLFLVGVRSEIGAMRYEFPKPTHGPMGSLPFSTLRTAIGDMEPWPTGEYYDYKFHGHYLTRNRKRSWDEPSYTIVADAHHVPLHPMGEPMRFVAKDTWALRGQANRRLSWRECAAIQGLPEVMTPSGPLEDKYRVVGNSVPPAFGRALLEPVVRFEQAATPFCAENPPEASERFVAPR